MNKDIKKIVYKIKHWCEDCDARAYDPFNPCSGHQQEKCLQERDEWVKNALKEVENE